MLLTSLNDTEISYFRVGKVAVGGRHCRCSDQSLSCWSVDGKEPVLSPLRGGLCLASVVNSAKTKILVCSNLSIGPSGSEMEGLGEASFFI